MKADEEKAREFQEIEIPYPQNDQPQIIYQEGYPPPQHAGFQPYEPNPTPVAMMAIPPSSDSKSQKILSYSRIIKWVALIDILLLFVYVAGDLWFFILLFIAFPICGVIGAHKLNKILLIIFFCYILLSILIRFISLFVVKRAAFIVFNVIFMLIEIAIAWVLFRLIRLLKTITEEERQNIVSNRSIAS